MNNEPLSLPPGKDRLSFDQEKVALIKRTVAKDLTTEEFELFIAVAKARGLDPILGQIHAVKRKDGDVGDKKMVLQVGIDGLRLIAARSGEYAGSDAATYEHNNENLITSASVTVYRIVQGQRVGFTGIAHWIEYCPSIEKMAFMWRKMPYSQLGKCAEAQALRKGFPNDLSSLYAPEEIQREVTESVRTGALEKGDNPEEKKVIELIAKLRTIGISERMICDKYNLEEAIYLNPEQCKELNQFGAAVKGGTKKTADFLKSLVVNA